MTITTTLCVFVSGLISFTFLAYLSMFSVRLLNADTPPMDLPYRLYLSCPNYQYH